MVEESLLAIVLGLLIWLIKKVSALERDVKWIVKLMNARLNCEEKNLNEEKRKKS